MALADLAERTQCARGKKEKCTALFHHLSVEHLAALLELQENRSAAWTGQAYEANLERNLGGLHGRLHRGAKLRKQIGNPV